MDGYRENCLLGTGGGCGSNCIKTKRALNWWWSVLLKISTARLLAPWVINDSESTNCQQKMWLYATFRIWIKKILTVMRISHYFMGKLSCTELFWLGFEAASPAWSVYMTTSRPHLLLSLYSIHTSAIHFILTFPQNLSALWNASLFRLRLPQRRIPAFFPHQPPRNSWPLHNLQLASHFRSCWASIGSQNRKCRFSSKNWDSGRNSN